MGFVPPELPRLTEPLEHPPAEFTHNGIQAAGTGEAHLSLMRLPLRRVHTKGRLLSDVESKEHETQTHHTDPIFTAPGL